MNYLPNDYYGSQGDQTSVNYFYTNSSAYYSPYQFNGNSGLNYSWDLVYETGGSQGDTNFEEADSKVNACQLFDEIPQTNSMEFQHESYRFGTGEGYEMMNLMRVELEKPKQKTTVKEYYEEFQNWRDDMLAMKSELSGQYFIDEFVHGLGWEIWMKVTRHKESPTSLNQAFLWALFEELVMARLKAAGITLIEYEGKTVIKYGAKIADPVEANDYETTQVAKEEVHEGMDKETIHGLPCELMEGEVVVITKNSPEDKTAMVAEVGVLSEEPNLVYKSDRADMFHEDHGELVEVIQVCHKHGVMHCDRKPENFLFGNKKETTLLKAIDFGLSVFFKPDERFNEIVGSPYYMAPEVLKRNYGPEVAIWSAGVIRYNLLCGIPPFWAETENGVAFGEDDCLVRREDHTSKNGENLDVAMDGDGSNSPLATLTRSIIPTLQANGVEENFVWDPGILDCH